MLESRGEYCHEAYIPALALGLAIGVVAQTAADVAFVNEAS
ncbi:MAG TPA: hypothetical protein VIQ99_06490 [Gammaproteobacteria bacterium]